METPNDLYADQRLEDLTAEEEKEKAQKRDADEEATGKESAEPDPQAVDDQSVAQQAAAMLDPYAHAHTSSFLFSPFSLCET